MASAVSADPQSWNRYTFVLNNPLRYVDPDGMMADEPWNQLTAEQQDKIASKLHIQEGQTAQQAFNNLFKDRSDKETSAIITGLQLALDEIPSDGKMWDQIGAFEGGWMKEDESVGLIFTVKNDEAFLSAAKESGYVVNDLNEIFNIGSGHKHSARQTTQSSYDPALHFVQQKGIPPRDLTLTSTQGPLTLKNGINSPILTFVIILVPEHQDRLVKRSPLRRLTKKLQYTRSKK